MPTDYSTLELFPPAADPPLLVLLRELVTGRGPRGRSSHPCPDGVTLDYLVWASGDRQPEDRDRVLRQLIEMERDGLVAQATVTDDETGQEDEVWRPTPKKLDTPLNIGVHPAS